MTNLSAPRRKLSLRPWLAGLAVLVPLALFALVFARPRADLGKAPEFVPSGRADATAVLDPGGFADQQQQAAYVAAHAIPAVLNQLYCWCHCRESTIFHHRSLLECFESDHASQCSICMGEALLASQMVHRGITDVRRIQQAIDAQFGPRSRPVTAFGPSDQRVSAVLRYEGSRGAAPDDPGNEEIAAGDLLDYSQLSGLIAEPDAKPDRQYELELSGGMMDGQHWTINGGEYPDEFNGARLDRPVLKDTITIGHMESFVADVVADNPGPRWLLHCHNLYHHMGGMAIELHYRPG